MSVIDSSPSNGPWIASAPCSNRWIPGHRRHWAEDGRERRREVAGTADQLVGRVDFLDADGSWASRGLRTSRSCRAIGSCLPAWASDSAVSAGEEHESEKDQSNGPGGHFNLARTWTSELGRGGSWNVTLIVHALVQDANDINAVRSGPIKQDMQAGGILAIALSYFQAFPTKRWALGHGCDVLPKLAGVRLCLVESPSIYSVIPDVIKISLSPWGEDEVARHRAVGFRFRLRAMNASKSNGVDTPLFSPSTRAARSAFIRASRSSSNRRAARMTSLALL